MAIPSVEKSASLRTPSWGVAQKLVTTTKEQYLPASVTSFVEIDLELFEYSADRQTDRQTHTQIPKPIPRTKLLQIIKTHRP